MSWFLKSVEDVLEKVDHTAATVKGSSKQSDDESSPRDFISSENTAIFDEEINTKPKSPRPKQDFFDGEQNGSTHRPLLENEISALQDELKHTQMRLKMLSSEKEKLMAELSVQQKLSLQKDQTIGVMVIPLDVTQTP
jgi:hypothetical protein